MSAKTLLLTLRHGMNHRHMTVAGLVRTMDLNADGLCDLVVSDWNKPSRCFINEGAGRFREIPHGLTPPFEVRHLDADAFPDVLVKVTGSGYMDVMIHWGQPDGSLGPCSYTPQAFAIGTDWQKVSNRSSWPRNWANCSLLQLYSHRNARAILHCLGQPNTFLASAHAARGLQIRAGSLWLRRRGSISPGR